MLTFYIPEYLDSTLVEFAKLEVVRSSISEKSSGVKRLKIELKKSTFCGDRTHDHWLKRPTLYHLS